MAWSRFLGDWWKMRIDCKFPLVGGESSSRFHCRQGKKEFVLVSSIQSVSNLYVGPQAFGPVFAKILSRKGGMELPKT